MKPMSMAEKLQILRDRYYLLVWPLVLLLALGLSTAPLLAWVAGSILVALTAFKLTGRG